MAQQYAPQGQPDPTGYAAPAGGYAPAPGGYGGSAPAAPAAPLDPNMNPFRGLKKGGDQTPVSEFMGSIVKCGIGAGRGFGATIDIDFERLQVIKSDTPYPYPTLTLSIKYSESLGSAWGRFAESVAKALGIALEDVEPAALVGHAYHLIRHDDVLFFTDKEGKEAKGTVWEMKGMMSEGAVAPVAQAAPVPPTAATMVAGTAVMEAPAPVAPIQATPAQASPATQTPEERALELLDGKDMATFFQFALPDEKIRQDANLLQSIFSQTFIQAKLATGQVAQNPDGTYTVVPQLPF